MAYFFWATLYVYVYDDDDDDDERWRKKTEEKEMHGTVNCIVLAIYVCFHRQMCVKRTIVCFFNFFYYVTPSFDSG